MKSFLEFLKESEELNEMTNKRINAAYDKVNRKYGRSLDAKYKNIKNFWHTSVYKNKENGIEIASASQNVFKNSTSFIIYRDKKTYVLRVQKGIMNKLKLQFKDGFEGVDDVYEFMSTLPEDALDAIIDSINKSFEIGLDREKLLKIASESIKNKK